MKDLSKEERLEQQIIEMAYTAGNKKWSRVKRTLFFLSGGIYLLALYYDGIVLGTLEIEECLYLLILAPVFAGLIMIMSYVVLGYIVTGAMEDEKAIAKKMGELNAIKYDKE